METIALDTVRQWSIHSNHIRVPAVIGSVCPRCGEKVVLTLGNVVIDSARSTATATATCPACAKRIHFWAVRDEQLPNDVSNNPMAIYMYPPLKGYYPIPNLSDEVPTQLRRAFVSTVEAFNSKNYTATAVCGRRTLEGVFKYLVSEDKRNTNLARLIELAKEQTDLAAPLTTLSHAIRDGGNLGAHFDMEKEPNENLARQMVELLEYLISYLYVLPGEIKKLEQSLGRDA